MRHYNVSFVKNLLNSNGKAFKCTQGVIAVEANSPNDAASFAKREFAHQHRTDHWRAHADMVEVCSQRHAVSA